MMGVELTDRDRELMTEEELAAMEFDEDSQAGEEAEEPEVEEPEVEEPEAPEKDKEDDPDKPEEDKDEPEPDKPEEGDKPDDKPEPEVEDPPAEEPDIPQVNFQPKIDSKIPDGLKQRIAEEAGKINAELEKQAADLKEQYDNGDIEAAEYIDKIDPIRQQMADNRSEVRDEMVSTWRDQEMGRQRWEAEQDAFFSIFPAYDAPKYDKDGNLESGNPVLYGALDAACSMINKKTPGLSGIELLKQAKVEVDKAMGLNQAKPKDEKPEDKPKPSAQRPGKTVGDLPAAHQEEAGEGEFAHLDKLSGSKLEEELEKLPAEKRDRYLAGA